MRSIAYVDEGRRELIIQTSGRIAGRDPYYQDICRLHIDTGELTPLLSVDTEVTLHHRRSFSLWGDGLQGKVSNTTGGVSPTGDFIVATCSRVDQAPVTVLLDREGNRLMEIEAADTRALSGNWTWPEPVQAKATDGETDLYGVLHRPSGFSAGQSYPVINYINSGPWISVVPKASFSSAGVYADRHYFYAQALAELGFVVLCLDSRGTPLRSKAFQDESYGWIPSAANTDDHVGAIKQLAEIYPEMDLDRVGIVCQFYRSGIQNFLERQDFYKVCVQMALHDSRMNPGCIEGEKYEGVNGPENNKPYAEDLAKNLEGKLLLMNVLNAGSSAVYPSAAAFRVVDALQKANKNFDMLFLPQAGGSVCNYYMFRRAWDYLLKHLAGVEPPKEVNLGEGGL